METDELKKCEARFLRAFMASPDGVAISRLSDSRIIEANQVLSAFLGYSREDFLHRTAFELGVWFHPEDRKRYSDLLREEGEAMDLETLFVRKDAAVVPVLISGKIVEFQGEPCIVSFIRDLSDRVYAREALLASEAHYRATLDSLADAIHVVDRDFNVVLFNETATRSSDALGLDVTGIIGRNLFEAFPFIPPGFREELERVFATGEALISGHSLELKGRVIFSEVKIIPLFEEGKVTRVVTVVRDITERKLREKALKESESKYRALMNNIPDISWSVDRKGLLIAMNETSLQLTGYEVNEIM